MHLLMEVARKRGLEEMRGEVLSNNHKMLALMKSLGFRVSSDPDDPGIKRVIYSL